MLASCNSERGDTPYPFDVRHRNILGYSSDSAGDYEDLKKSITTRLTATLSKAATIKTVTTTTDTEGLAPHEMTTLVLIKQNQLEPETGIAVNSLESEMWTAGFNKLALSMALTSLLARGMIHCETVSGWGAGHEYNGYFVQQAGYDWPLRNLHMMQLRVEHKTKSKKWERELGFRQLRRTGRHPILAHTRCRSLGDKAT